MTFKYEPETVKGFQDFLPPQSLKRAAVKQVVEKWFRLFGFTPIETPIIEFDELMRPDTLPSEQADEAVSERFKLEDRGSRKLGLRYEFTFQLARILKENPNIKLPFKRYQIGEVFRDEPVSSKRFRQFTQCDIDILGDSSTNADAECLAAFSSILKELRVESEIEVNNSQLLTSIIESVEIDDVKGIMRELDKVEKLGADEVKANLRKYTTPNQIITLFRLLEKPLSFFKENAFKGVEELQSLGEDCDFYGVKIKFNPFLARGLSYYTGNLFEIKLIDENKKKLTIAAGGRYDNSAGKFINKKVPAVGISFGLERLTEFAKIKPLQIPKTLLISISQDKQTISLAQELRNNEISCLVSFDKVGKALEFANAQAIQFVVFVGQEEVGSKKFKLKNMLTGKESLLTEKSLIRVLKN